MSFRSEIGPFAIIPEWVFKHENIGGREVLVYLALAMRASRDNQQCWPGHELIAEDADMSVASVKRALTRLREAGAVTWVRTQSSSKYTIHQVQPESGSLTTELSDSSPVNPVSSPVSEQIAHPRATNHNQEPEPIEQESFTAPSAERKPGPISVLEWDSSAAGREAVGKSLAVRFYSWCRQNQEKRPAVKHKAFVNLIDDLLERGYHEDEVWDLLQLHQKDGFPWTLNAIAVTESKLKKAQPAAQQELPDDWTEEEKAEYYRLKAGPDFMTQLLETGEIR